MTQLTKMRVSQGGLMRCCTGTLGEMFDEDKNQEMADGQTIDCRYEEKGNQNMIVDGDRIRWNREKFFPNDQA